MTADETVTTDVLSDNGRVSDRCLQSKHQEDCLYKLLIVLNILGFYSQSSSNNDLVTSWALSQLANQEVIVAVFIDLTGGKRCPSVGVTQ
jgi:hypothetical protein